MPPDHDLRRGNFPYLTPVPTRWSDNDMLGHVNNVVYYRYFEAAIVRFLMEEGGLDWVNDPVVAFAVESLCRFHRPLSFPEHLEVGIRIEKIGNSSLVYGLSIFSEGIDAPAATGRFVHVFVDRVSEKSAPIPGPIRTACETFT